MLLAAGAMKILLCTGSLSVASSLMVPQLTTHGTLNYQGEGDQEVPLLTGHPAQKVDTCTACENECRISKFY